MNSSKATFAMAILVVVAAVVYEINKSRDIQAALATVRSERDDLSRQVKALSRNVADLKNRESASPVIAPPAAAAPAAPAQKIEPVAMPGVTIKAPAGWAKNGSKPNSYVVGVDTNQSLGGMPSAYVKSLEPSVDGFGGMMQMSSAEDYAGKRIRMTGWAKTADANDGGGHLWLRVDGQQPGQSLQFDNMDNRPLKGNTDWQQYSIVLDVPKESAALAYGFFVSGTGQMWVNNTKIEEVGPDVPSTNMLRPRTTRALPKTPNNLNFADQGTP
jgi:hypothetical protein